MRKKIFLLSILFLLTIIPSYVPDIISAEAPHIVAQKTISPGRVLEGQTFTVRVRLTGAGDLAQNPVDVVLVLDRSGSMGGDKIDDARDAAKEFIEVARVNEVDKVGLVTFSSDVRVDFELQYMNSTNKELLEDAIDSFLASGATNIHEAMETANDLLTDSPRIAPLVEVLLTDGNHNYPTFLPDSDFEDLANEAKDQHIIIYTIGLGDDVNTESLEMIADVTGGRYFFAPTSDDLEEIFAEIATLLSFAGTNIEVTETIPSYITYNGDASKTPDNEPTLFDGETQTLIWDVGTLWIGEEWEVTYTARADKAVESSDLVSQTRIVYDAISDVWPSTTTIDLKPGVIYNDIAITSFITENSRIAQGDMNDFIATVESQGSVQRTFDVELRYDSTLISKKPLTLDPGQSKNITFSWNTTNVDTKEYNVTVTADPDNEVWEQDRSDNTATVKVEIYSSSMYPIFFILMGILLILVVPIIAATRYSKPRTGPPTCEACGESLFYDKRTGRWYCRRCGRYVL